MASNDAAVEITLGELNDITGWELAGFDRAVYVHCYIPGGRVTWVAQGTESGLGVELGTLDPAHVTALLARHGTSVTHEAIRQSQTRNEIVHLAWSEEVETDLIVKCEDSADGVHVSEYWGENAAGTWRVHLVRGEG